MERFRGEFADTFRGSSEAIKQRVSQYAGLIDLRELAVVGPAVDVGCGRGEWLDVLTERGVRAYGLETDAALARAARRRGLDVRAEDGLDHLRGLPAGSMGLVSLIHVVEHLTFDELAAFAGEAHRVLAPGGVFLAETPNPANLVVPASFYNDPTHLKPIPAALLEFVGVTSGFGKVAVHSLNPPPGGPFVVPGPLAGDPDMTRIVDRLNDLLNGGQDSVLIATKTDSGEDRPPRRRVPRRRRLALVSPLPPQRSGVADYSARLADALSSEVAVDLVVADVDRHRSERPAIGLGEFVSGPGRHTDVVYVMGNSRFHTFMFEAMRRTPGVVLAHEARFTSMLQSYTRERSLPDGWLADLIEAEYPALRPRPRAALSEDEAVDTGVFLMGPIIDRATRVLTTSEFTAEVARRERPGRHADIACVGYGYPVRPPESRAGRGTPFRIGTVGVQSGRKGIEVIVEATARVRRVHPDLELVIGGYLSPDLERAVRRRADELGVSDAVVLPGWVDAAGYADLVAGLDLGVQLRRATNGEVSGAIGDLLAGGVPAVVSDVGPNASLPDEAVAKVPIGVGADALGDLLLDLIRSPARREALGAAGRRFTHANGMDLAARRLLSALG